MIAAVVVLVVAAVAVVGMVVMVARSINLSYDMQCGGKSDTTNCSISVGGNNSVQHTKHGVVYRYQRVADSVDNTSVKCCTTGINKSSMTNIP